MKIISPAFENNSAIPSKYTCEGENINPPLEFLDVPANAKSLVLIMDDPDAPMGTASNAADAFVHWVLYNINPSEKGIAENSLPVLVAQGKTGRSIPGYVGPCPPLGTHRYFFKLYALDIDLDLQNADKNTIEEKMHGHILDKAELMGLYRKNNQ